MKKLANKVLLILMGSLIFNVKILAITDDSFVIVVQTDNSGLSADNEFIIPTYSGSIYNYSVDCDNNGTYEATGIDGNYTCVYSPDNNSTPRNIVIDGVFPRIYFNFEGDKDKILFVDKWGSQQWESMEKAFSGAKNLLYVPDIPTPDLSQVTNMSKMFAAADSFNADLGSWDVSNVSFMNEMFLFATAFNGDISDWNTSNVLGFPNMFTSAHSFNQDISTWNTSNSVSMYSMFTDATTFNQDISNWNVSKVQDMNKMFWFADTFSQDIANWNVSSVYSMSKMFLDKNMTVSDYDHLLHSWSILSLASNVTFDAGNSHYCNGLAAKSRIETQFGWTINDAGENCDFYIDTPYLQTVQPGAPQKVVTLSTHSVGTDPVSYSIVGGSDRDKFFLSTPNGSELNIYSTDIDHPADNNKDNIYRVRIRAESGSYSDQRTIRVKVSNNTVLVPIIYYLLQ